MVKVSSTIRKPDTNTIKIDRKEVVNVAKVRTSSSSDSSQMGPPALYPESRQNQMIALAENLAEKQLRDGTASSQVISHYLKLATEKARLEVAILERERDLITAKTEQLQSQKRTEELYAAALKAMRNYNGQGDPDEY